MPPTDRRRHARADSTQATRAALVTAALAEFAAHGFDTPSLDAICARAGYTRGAFYVHFRDRAALMSAVVEHAMGTFLDAMLAHGDAASDLERTVGRFADAVVQTLGARRRGVPPAIPLPAGVPFARILDAVTRDTSLRETFATLLGRAVAGVGEIAAHGQRARTARADVEADQIGSVLVLLALGILVAIDAGLPFDPPRLRTTVLTLLSPGRSDGPRARRGRSRGSSRG
ncbi:MAG: TetR/AcrR family transcriptional regulator [Deltaproteobacteria bacterium]|nr:TetR/AcrR family transcriptional regulator [Deltaproteobacteria bacterium]